MTDSPTAFPRRELALVLLAALAARLLLLISGSVSFHADEALIGLMARHILQGERPVFFYGQAYMGSLDAWAVALGFRLLGESVLTLRLVQSVLYLLAVALGFGAAWQLSRRRGVAWAAGLLLAFPTVNAALYTTATLGGYNEILILGSAMLWLGHSALFDAPHNGRGARLRWLLLGLAAGLGWWTSGLIVVYALPLALLILREAWRGRVWWPGIGVALVGFTLGSAPWWLFDLTHNGAALSTYFRSRQSGLYAGIGITDVPPLERLLGLLVLGIPALVGMRFPWADSFFLPVVGLLVIGLYGLALLRLRRQNPLRPGGRLLVAGMSALFMLVFVASTFGADPSGRYFLPLALPLAILLGTLVESLRTQMSRWRGLALLPLVLVLSYQGAGQLAAARGTVGFTTQFDPISHLPNEFDSALMDFLDAHDLHNGYTNYWIAFRLAFLSGERLQYRAALPYKADLSYNPADDRYPPYAAATDQAARVAFITSNLPELDARLVAWFAAQDLRYSVDTLGPYRIYYDFSARPAFETGAILSP